jgi:hypothetical protein
MLLQYSINIFSKPNVPELSRAHRITIMNISASLFLLATYGI